MKGDLFFYFTIFIINNQNNMSYTLTLRETKGEALTFTELDQNFELLYSGSQNGTYIQYSNITASLAGQGFGNIVECVVVTTPVTASQIVTFSTNPPNDQLQVSPSSISQSGSMLGVALQTGNPGDTIQVLTEGYYAAYNSGSNQTNNYFKDLTTTGGSPIYFSGSFVTVNKPNTNTITRPLGYVLNSLTGDGIRYVKFCPSITTLA